MVARRSVCALVVALAVACAHEDAEKKAQPAIHAVKVDGAKGVSASDTAKKILNTESPFWALWFPYLFPPSRFDRNTWPADLKRVERYYQSQGYYQAEVVGDSVVQRDKGTGGLFLEQDLGGTGKVYPLSPSLPEVDLHIQVVEGEPTKLQTINVVGLEELPPNHRKVALDALSLKLGAVFKESEWDGVKERMQDALREVGYAEAVVKGEAFVEATNQTARVTLEVTPGPRYHFGKISVAHPAPRVPEYRIREEADAAIKPGSWYSESALVEAQQRVFKMGVFGAVKVTRATPNPATGTVDVVVDAREAPTHSLKVGPGISADALHWEGVASGEYQDRNFLGGLRKLTLRLKAGWAFLPDPWAVIVNSRDSTESPKDGPIAKFTAEFEQPYFLARDIRYQAGFDTERQLDQAYTDYYVRPRTGLIWQPHPFFSIYGSFNLQYDKLLFDPAVGGVSGTTPTFALGCRTLDCSLLLNYFEETIQWDRRNDRYEPTHGYYLNLNLQEGRSYLEGAYNYIRLQPEGRYYVPLTPRLTLALRAKLGFLYTNNGQSSAITTRFYSGGDDMRGFDSRRLSPMLAVPQYVLQNGYKNLTPVSRDGLITSQSVYGQTVAIGGNGLLEGSAELRYNLIGPLVVAIFFDTGTVTTCPVGQKSVSQIVRTGSSSTVVNVCVPDSDYVGANLQYAVGFGLRYKTPIGPIRADFAYRLGTGDHRPLEVEQPTGGTQVTFPSQTTCFGIGQKGLYGPPSIAGYPEGPCTVQISIGEAF